MVSIHLTLLTLATLASAQNPLVAAMASNIVRGIVAAKTDSSVSDASASAEIQAIMDIVTKNSNVDAFLQTAIPQAIAGLNTDNFPQLLSQAGATLDAFEGSPDFQSVLTSFRAVLSHYDPAQARQNVVNNLKNPLAIITPGLPTLTPQFPSEWASATQKVLDLVSALGLFEAQAVSTPEASTSDATTSEASTSEASTEASTSEVPTVTSDASSAESSATGAASSDASSDASSEASTETTATETSSDASASSATAASSASSASSDASSDASSTAASSVTASTEATTHITTTASTGTVTESSSASTSSASATSIATTPSSNSTSAAPITTATSAPITSIHNSTNTTHSFTPTGSETITPTLINGGGHVTAGVGALALVLGVLVL